MAGRIRSIKPEILDDEKTAALGHLEWRLFVSVWLIADDFGNFRGDPMYVMGQVLWSAGETRARVAAALESIAEVDLLTRYSVRGQTYYHVNGWDKHQRVDKPGKPRMPGPHEADTECSPTVTDDSRDQQEMPGIPRATPAPDLRPKTNDQDQRAAALSEVAIGEINRIAGTGHVPGSESAMGMCRALVKQKRTAEDVLLVIRSKASWATSETMREHFKPSTLLGPKNFVKYLDEARAGPPTAPLRFEGNRPPERPNPIKPWT